MPELMGAEDDIKLACIHWDQMGLREEGAWTWPVALGESVVVDHTPESVDADHGGDVDEAWRPAWFAVEVAAFAVSCLLSRSLPPPTGAGDDRTGQQRKERFRW